MIVLVTYGRSLLARVSTTVIALEGARCWALYARWAGLEAKVGS